RRAVGRRMARVMGMLHILFETARQAIIASLPPGERDSGAWSSAPAIDPAEPLELPVSAAGIDEQRTPEQEPERGAPAETLTGRLMGRRCDGPGDLPGGRR